MKMRDCHLTQNQVVDVDLDDAPRDRWQNAMDEVGDHVHAIVDDTVECCESHLDYLPPALNALYKIAIHGAVGVGGWTAGMIARLFGQEYSSEIRGMAKYVGVSYPRLLLGNLMYDLTQMFNHREAGCRQPAACSSYSCNLPGGIPVLARNMDWAIPESVGRHTVLVRFHRGKRSYTSVGIAGLVGILSAMRPGHWAVTLNQAPVECVKPRWLQTPALQRLRQACDGFGGFGQLVRRAQEYQTMTPFFLHAVGTKPNQHVVINCLGDYFVKRSRVGDYLIQTNHYVNKELAELNGTEEWLDEDGTKWTWDSRPRYSKLKRRLRQLPKTLGEALGKLKRSPITNENTMQQMAFCPLHQEMRLKVQV